MHLVYSAMDFAAGVRREEYRSSFLNNSSVLVSGRQGDYILYKNRVWRCADDISTKVVEELGKVIDAYIQRSIRNRNSFGETAPSH